MRRMAVALGLVLLLATSAMAEDRRFEVRRWTEDWSWLAAGSTADPFDGVKNVALGGDWFLSWGGSARVRHEADSNRTLGASPVEDDSLFRFRAFTHLELRHGSSFRWFGEARYSDTWSEDRPVPAIFRDDVDVQNFFLEWTAGPGTTTPVTVRLGRQELQFGAQRLVSPLDWANTRRTFDGLTVGVTTPRTETTFFVTHPVAHEVHDIDSPVDEQFFGGVHAVVRPFDGHRFEGYAYHQDDSRRIHASEVDGSSGRLDRTTLGFRHAFEKSWRFETELAWQGGDHGRDDIEAYMASFTAGYAWKDVSWKPSIEVGLDVASGDSDDTDGRRETFNQLFPLGHAYFGHLDLVARQNVRAARVQFSAKPTKRLKCVFALHRFELDESADALYAASGASIRKATGPASREVATEADLLFAWRVDRHQSVAFEVSRWWSDDFIEETGSGDDAWFTWTGYEFRF